MRKNSTHLLLLALCCCAAQWWSASHLAAQERSSRRIFVTVKDGHFFAGERRLRLWGINISAHHVMDHKGADVTVRRMKELGFNCLHIWLPRGSLHRRNQPYLAFRRVKKGDGSPLDLLDYMVHLCDREGLYVSLPVLSVRGDEITPDAFDVIPGGAEHERTAWLEGVRKGGKGFRHLKFVDERIKALYLKHAEFFLNRVSPYTGRRYADEPTVAFWQLEDEMEFLSWPPDIERDSRMSRQLAPRWSRYLRQRFADEADLVRAWGKLWPGESWAEGTIRLFPTHKHGNIPAPRLREAWTFLYGLSGQFYDEYLPFIRRQAAAGVGINVQPIAVDSLIYNRPGCMFPALQASSFQCGTGFRAGGRLVEVDGVPTWRLPTDQRPPWKGHYATDTSCLRAAGTPYCPVAGAARTNDPYRAAAPVIRALWAAWQDWDGVFTYWWGYFLDKKPLRSNADYRREGLRYATPEKRSSCFEICHDEIALSQHRVASAILRRGLLAPAASPTVFRLGRRTLFGPAATDYYHRRWPEIPATAWSRGAFVKLDPTWDGEMEAVGPTGKPPDAPLAWPNGVTWDWQNGRIVADTPKVKAFLGTIDGGFTFKDGVSLSGVSRRFICFALASEDGQPLARSRRAVMSLVSQSANTGVRFDSTKVTKNRFGYLQPHTGCVSSGGLPIVVNRVTARITLPPLPGRLCRKLDFAGRQLTVEPAIDSITLREDEPAFYCELTRN